MQQKTKSTTKGKVMKTFNELRLINVNEHTDKKGKFTYLSWNWAVDQLLQNDPSATWTFGEPVYFNETLMVFCTVTAFGKSMTCQMPVINNKNTAISNPNAMDVNTGMMRCLTKCISLFGIGLYIYAGEDLPEEESIDMTESALQWVDSIKICTTIDQLKETYAQAYKFLAKDKSAVATISIAKDAKKAELGA
jgi:hypothetical protein